jgi:predicted phage-related endonuclease
MGAGNKMNPYIYIPDENHFQKIRFTTIGASDLPIILGLSTFTTPHQLWRYKTKRDKSPDLSGPAYWGHAHEPNILGSYIEENANFDIALKFKIDYLKHIKKRPKKYKPPTKYLPFTEFYHPDLEWAMAHLDMVDLVLSKNIEAKSGRSFASYKRDGMDGFDKDEKAGVPLKYYIQVNWQMLCSGLRKTHLRALIDTSDEMQFEIDYNKKITEKLIEAASRFMWHIKKDKEPMPINKKDIEKLFPRVNEKTSYIMGADAVLANKMKERKKILSIKQKKIKSEITDINDSLFVMIGANKYLFDENNNKICSQSSYERENLKDLKGMKENHNDLYNQLVKEGYLNKSIVRKIN